MLTYPSKK